MKQHQPQKVKQHTLYKPKQRLISLKSTRWQRLREQVLHAEPLCRTCTTIYGRTTPASDVDHIDNNGNNNTLSNLQPLCHSCHSKKTRHEMQGGTPSAVPSIKGCNANGFPIDPNHEWNKEKTSGKITSNRQRDDRAPSHANATAKWEFQ